MMLHNELNQHSIRLNKEKCKFKIHKLNFIENGIIKHGPEKEEVIAAISPLKTRKDLMFLLLVH